MAAGRLGWPRALARQGWPGSEVTTVKAARPPESTTGAREREQPRRSAASEKTTLPMGSTVKEQEAAGRTGKPPRWERK